MAYREFTDAHGVYWEVWDVQREATERRRMGERRRRLAPPFEGAERRHGLDRRAATMRAGIGAATAQAPGAARGWLAFQARHEKRRLEPIPAGWEQASVAELQAWCRGAIPQPARRLLE